MISSECKFNKFIHSKIGAKSVDSLPGIDINLAKKLAEIGYDDVIVIYF
jgi:hypothetical protein